MPFTPSTFIKYKQFHTLLSSRDFVVFTTSHLGFCQVFLPVLATAQNHRSKIAFVFVARGRELYHAEVARTSSLFMQGSLLAPGQRLEGSLSRCGTLVIIHQRRLIIRIVLALVMP